MKKQGFTLIELLVVVAIIALLMSGIDAGIIKSKKTGSFCQVFAESETLGAFISDVRR